MAGRWATSAFRWVASDLLPFSSGIQRRWPLRWASMGLPQLSFSIVDDVVWSVVTAFESVALVSMLCFFFLFCGCTF
ncbi:hypothetical protein GQ457_02G036980 [Hibiscus cannabinus]